MRTIGLALLTGFCLLLSASLVAQEASQKKGAVLLLPASDMDRELAGDLTEVLISSVLDASNKSIRVVGKEVFRRDVGSKKTDEGIDCLEDHDCLRAYAKEESLFMLLVGKVGKAANGYRLEVWRIQGKGNAEKHYRKRIKGDIGNLINEMDRVARWALEPDNARLRIVTNIPGASLFLNGKPLDAKTGTIEVKPGLHRVTGKKTGHEECEVQVTCKAGKTCEARLDLVPIKTADPIKKPEVDKDDGERSSLWPYVYVFGGVALASAGAGVYTYLEMQNKQSEIEDKTAELCPNNQCTVTQQQFFDEINPIRDQGDDMAMWTNIMLGVAIGSAATATTLMVIELLSDDPEPSKTVFAPVVSPDFSGFSFELRF